jgi:hypothetical protein
VLHIVAVAFAVVYSCLVTDFGELCIGRIQPDGLSIVSGDRR